MEDFKDTIAAVATAAGEASLGIVRLSGSRALEIADKIFVNKKGLKPSGFKTYTMHYGKVVYAGAVLDEAVLSVMRAPYSYTREDVVEINCHGGTAALRRILDAVLDSGCRMAGPGEFTRRAFLNGRIDLAQAEAVIDIIRAKTGSALKLGLEQLEGNLSREINKICRLILDILAELEAHIDFPEEDIGKEEMDGVSRSLQGISGRVKRLLDGAETGRILRDGMKIAICGRPNVGKSSLLNALLKKERAIVTPLAGTTRDSIEEQIDIKGIPVRVIDTAGILKPRNVVERKSVCRAKSCIRSADLVIILFDASRKLGSEDREFIREVKNKKAIAAINKIDLKTKIDKPELCRVFGRVEEISAKKSTNIGLLEDAIYEFACRGELLDSEHILVSNLRHIEALKETQFFLKHAACVICDRLPLEFLAQDLKDACARLDRVLGKDTSAGLLDKIFSNFCIGK
jgi:tRNA modification GTPase